MVFPCLFGMSVRITLLQCLVFWLDLLCVRSVMLSVMCVVLVDV